LNCAKWRLGGGPPGRARLVTRLVTLLLAASCGRIGYEERDLAQQPSGGDGAGGVPSPLVDAGAPGVGGSQGGTSGTAGANSGGSTGVGGAGIGGRSDASFGGAGGSLSGTSGGTGVGGSVVGTGGAGTTGSSGGGSGGSTGAAGTTSTATGGASGATATGVGGGSSGKGGASGGGAGGIGGGAGTAIDAGSTLCSGGVCKRVFVSSTMPPSADLGGLAGADAICQSLADAHTFGGAFKAWLSDHAASPSTRFTLAAVPYVLLDGTVIANNWTDLTDGTLAHPIDMDESAKYLQTASGVEVWTGTTTTGTSTGTDCNGWTSAKSCASPLPACVGSNSVARVGNYALSDSGWTTVYEQYCDRTDNHLYCFEQ
jgi:hypothetical protein